MSSIKLAALLTASSLVFAASARRIAAADVACGYIAKTIERRDYQRSTNCRSGGFEVRINGVIQGGVTIKQPACPLVFESIPPGAKCAPSENPRDGCSPGRTLKGYRIIYTGCVNGSCNTTPVGPAQDYGEVQFDLAAVCLGGGGGGGVDPLTSTSSPGDRQNGSVAKVSLSGFDQARLPA